MKGIFRPIACCIALLAASMIADANPATEPVPRENEFWRARHEVINRRALEAGRKAQIIFVGDSITEFWEKPDGGQEVWTRYYAARNAVNLGVAVDGTQHVLWRLEHGNLTSLDPKLAVVMIGTNNISDSYFDGATLPQIAEGVGAVVNKLREKLPRTRILLMGILPRGLRPNPQRGDALQINQMIQNLADGRKVFYCDFGARLVASDGTIPSKLMPDHIHLSPAGYRIWAESIEGQVARMLGDAR